VAKPGGSGQRQGSSDAHRRRHPWPRALHAPTIAILIVGVVVTSTLAAVVRAEHDHTEQRLLTLDTQLTSAAIAVAVFSVENRLQAAGEEASASNGDPSVFDTFARRQLSPTNGWRSESLWRLSPRPTELADVGAAQNIATSPGAMLALFTQASRSSSFVVTDLTPQTRVLGFAYAQPTAAGTDIVYAEAPLTTSRRLKIKTGSPLDDLNYVGATLIATTGPLQLAGPTSTATTPFGSNSVLTLVTSARVPLAGSLAAWLAWFVLLVGLVFTVLIASMSEHLVRRRQRAEALAVENRRLFQAQRSTAETLQRALLPHRMPEPPQLQVAARYVPGADGLEVGGDWYNVTDYEDGRLFFAVGDVSGRGMQAASLMAELRFSIKAFAAEDPQPSVVLNRLGRLIDIGDTDHFATVLCGLFDTASGTVTLANAGHPDPVLVTEGRAALVPTRVGPPIGLGHRRYEPVDVTVETILAYTDGLIERRNEDITDGFERLRAASERAGQLDELLDDILLALVPDGSSDDVVVLGIRWGA
jgi:serine phosphatase RsbU (regulator of sigma subunit)